MYWVFEYHMDGGAYVTDVEPDFDGTEYCDICGDFDRLLGAFPTEMAAVRFADKYNAGEYGEDDSNDD